MVTEKTKAKQITQICMCGNIQQMPDYGKPVYGPYEPKPATENCPECGVPLDTCAAFRTFLRHR